MKKVLIQKLIQQLNIEHSAYFHYMEMSTLAEDMGLKGVGLWLRHQAYEEMEHMMKYFHYLLDRGQHISLAQLTPSNYSFKSIKELFDQALKNEKYVTKTTYETLELATKEKEYATIEFLQWFVSEQVEEEAQINDILSSIEILGKDSRSLYFLDKELAKKVRDFHDYKE